MKYSIQDREAGNKIAEFATFEEANSALTEFEAQDKTDGTYSHNFYEIVGNEK